MKKVLVLVLMAGVVQGLYSQEPTQYKHLNKLPNYSKIRIKCEQVNRALFVKGTAEKSCDTLDKFFDTLAQVTKAQINGTSLANIEKNAPSTEELENAFKNLGVTDKDVAEIGYMGALGQQIVIDEQLGHVYDMARRGY